MNYASLSLILYYSREHAVEVRSTNNVPAKTPRRDKLPGRPQSQYFLSGNKECVIKNNTIFCFILR